MQNGPAEAGTTLDEKAGLQPWPLRVSSGAAAASKSTWVEMPDENGGPAAWCYSDKRSYMPGETLRLFISSTVNNLTVEVSREGIEQSIFKRVDDLDVSFQRLPNMAYMSGCDWQETIAIELPLDLRPGAYIVSMRAHGQDVHSPALGHHIFFVRSRRGGCSNTLLMVAATCTWSAYNDWGGASHYRGLHPQYPLGVCPTLSASRPWARGQVWLPPGAPRNVSKPRPRTPMPPDWESKEWAFANGYTRYYATAGWPSYERPFLLWAEQSGYSVHVIPQDDLELHPDCVSGYDCLVFVGHDEYWSTPMRQTVDSFTERGGKVARFAGNFMWQIRLAENGAGQTCYKYMARDHDPVRHENPKLMTGAWEDPIIGYPGAETFGVNALRGVYAGVYAMAPRSARGFNVFRPKHWSLERTGLGYADMFGDEASIFAFEVDGLDYQFVNGLPEPLGTDGAPEGVQIIAMNWATKSEYGLPEHAYYHVLGDGDARYTATILEGNESPQAVEKHSRGTGMVVSFQKGEGEVFCAATCEWVRGLIEHDFYTEQITRNVLDRFLNNRG
ncbi:N,N-dimethylformamidase beta subunit family domain-containing protein [Mesorhizobium sp. M0323]|uniref:N,N-dimethylformamidase beta subunit family domain-containing protein n=1 Tax=Mesorhizobium sp. M0323 TaxID=2956938 RepID=UPI00333AD8DC